jgi:hypothetical protein
VEIDDAGRAIRSASSDDPAFPGALLTPYSLVVLPELDRVVSFPGGWCGVPTIVGHYLIEGPLEVHGLVALDIANGTKPVEVSRLTLGDTYYAHWTAWDPKTERLVVTSGRKPEDRLYLVKLDPRTGALSLDESFRDLDGKPGLSFMDREWPHGAVFSRRESPMSVTRITTPP